MVVAAETVEMDSGALARVEALFLEQIHQGLHPGAALAVYRHGQPVLDLYGGVADTRSGKPSSRNHSNNPRLAALSQAVRDACR